MNLFYFKCKWISIIKQSWCNNYKPHTKIYMYRKWKSSATVIKSFQVLYYVSVQFTLFLNTRTLKNVKAFFFNIKSINTLVSQYTIQYPKHDWRMSTNLKYKLADRNICLKMATTTTERANEILDDGTLAEEVSKKNYV